MSVFIATPRIAVAAIRQNAPVQTDRRSETPSSFALVPMVVVAVAVLVLALMVSGVLWRSNGTIVVQRITTSMSAAGGAKAFRRRPMSVTTINETSSNGRELRAFIRTSTTGPGFEQVISADAEQLYDPLDNTIYAVRRPAGMRTMPTVVTTASMELLSPGSAYLYGSASTSLGWLRYYKLVGRERIDGQSALEFVDSSPRTHFPHSRGFEFNTTIYVAAGSHNPIETISRMKFPGVRTTSITRWQTYAVLPATAANQRLLSLAARHPHARVIHGFRSFVRATERAYRTRFATIVGANINSAG